MDNSERESGTTIGYIIENKRNRKGADWKPYCGIKDLTYAVDRVIRLQKAYPASNWRLVKEERTAINIPELC